jgi:transposase InsO family protein
VLYRYSQDNDEEAAQLLVLDHERTRVLKQYHDLPTAGHYGIERAHHRIQQRYYWPGMRRYIADYLKTCHECQRYKPHNLKPADLLQTPVLQQWMEVIAIDLFGPLPPASTGERWILIIEDYATRWIELFALVDATADRCAWTFVNEVCLRYGIPRKLISDNGTQLISAIMQTICFCLGISQAFTPVYHPEANPVECRNRDLKTQLAIQIRDKPHSDWPRQLSSTYSICNEHSPFPKHREDPCLSIIRERNSFH